MTNTMNTPIESLEITYPLRVEACELREGSSGAGLDRGLVAFASCVARSRGARLAAMRSPASSRPMGCMWRASDGKILQFVIDQVARAKEAWKKVVFSRRPTSRD